MRKRILLIGYNYHPEPTGIGKYNGEMIDWFVKEGYDCTVLTSYPYYPYWKVQEPYYKRRFWYTTEETKGFQSAGALKVIRCPQYVPVKPSGLKRIILDLTFLFSATFPLIGLIVTRKFDFVITVAPSFQFGLLGVLCKKVRKAKLIYHTQDMQIEAARDLKMIKSKGLINALFKVEKFIYNQSEIVSSISEGMVNRIKEKAKKDVFLFPNWTDIDLFFPMANLSEIKREFGYAPDDKIALYSGSIGEKQGLEAILHAADKLRKVDHLKFVICGSGPYKTQLQMLAQSLNLDNVNFLPLQPFDKFNHFLNIADLHLIIQKSGASDLVMPSKLTTIFAVGGLSLITANEGSGLYTLAHEHKIGLVIEAENQTALNEGIYKAITEDYSQINKNARLYAEKYLSIDNVMRNFQELMHNQQRNTLPAVNTNAGSGGKTLQGGSKQPLSDPEVKVSGQIPTGLSNSVPNNSRP